MNQLRQLGFLTVSSDYAVNDVEGVIVKSYGDTWVWFVLKSVTHSFTPKLFQFICARCAALSRGTIYLECDDTALAGLYSALADSELSKWLTKSSTPSHTLGKTVIHELEVDYFQERGI